MRTGGTRFRFPSSGLGVGFPILECLAFYFSNYAPQASHRRPTLDNGLAICHTAAVADTAIPEVLPTPGIDAETGEQTELDPGYLGICWDDPVNLMDYVTHVFQTVFGWPRARAERQMMQVHKQGKSVLVRESKEKAEHYVHQLQKYSLHATMERDAS